MQPVAGFVDLFIFCTFFFVLGEALREGWTGSLRHRMNTKQIMYSAYMYIYINSYKQVTMLRAMNVQFMIGIHSQTITTTVKARAPPQKICTVWRRHTENFELKMCRLNSITPFFVVQWTCCKRHSEFRTAKPLRQKSILQSDVHDRDGVVPLRPSSKGSSQGVTSGVCATPFGWFSVPSRKKINWKQGQG